MKLTKMLGLALVAAFAAMAFAGAGTAMADTACQSAEYESPCAEENEMQPGDPLKGVLKSATAVLTGTLAVTCSESKVEGEITENGGSVVKGLITNVTFNSCSNCKEAKSRPGAEFPTTVNWLGFASGTQTDDFTVSNPVVDLIDCTFLKLKCTATATNVVLDMATTASQTTIDADTVPLNLSGGFLCGTSGTWDATYRLVDPEDPEEEEAHIVWVSEV